MICCVVFVYLNSASTIVFCLTVVRATGGLSYKGLQMKDFFFFSRAINHTFLIMLPHRRFPEETGSSSEGRFHLDRKHISIRHTDDRKLSTVR